MTFCQWCATVKLLIYAVFCLGHLGYKGLIVHVYLSGADPGFSNRGGAKDGVHAAHISSAKSLTAVVRGAKSAIPKPLSYGACISLWRSIEKNCQKSPRIALELPTFGSTEQCFTNTPRTRRCVMWCIYGIKHMH